VTPAQSRRLDIGQRVAWHDSAEDQGTASASDWSGVRIEWDNGKNQFFHHTERKIRRGIYRSVAALRAEIMSFIEHHNDHPKPFQWTRSADDILKSIERFCACNSPANA
jgi:hypothetical protein